MPSFQIHRLKEPQRQNYRWAPHTSGVTVVKPKDYELAETIEAGSVYAVWDQLRPSSHPLQVGDVLSDETGQLRICKYVGFEEATWFVPESPVPAIPVPDPPQDAVR